MADGLNDRELFKYKIHFIYVMNHGACGKWEALFLIVSVTLFRVSHACLTVGCV